MKRKENYTNNSDLYSLIYGDIEIIISSIEMLGIEDDFIELWERDITKYMEHYKELGLIISYNISCNEPHHETFGNYKIIITFEDNISLNKCSYTVNRQEFKNW